MNSVSVGCLAKGKRMFECWHQRSVGVLIVVLWIGLLSSLPVFAQAPQNASPTVQAYGEEVIELAPQKIRLLFMAKAEGADAKEAIAAMAKHKKNIREELFTLKANEESIQMGPAEIHSHIMGLPKQYWGMSTKSLKGFLTENTVNINLEEMPIVFTATCVVEADWILPTTDPDVLAQLPDSIRRQTIERDLIGENNPMPLSPEQEARVEKLKAAFEDGMGYYDSQDDPTNIHILFVATVNSKQRAEALKAAFDQAKDECQALAEASGNRLGSMVSLARATPDEANDWMLSASPSDDNEILQSRQGRASRQGEYTSARSDLLTAKFQIRAIYSIAP